MQREATVLPQCWGNAAYTGGVYYMGWLHHMGWFYYMGELP